MPGLVEVVGRGEGVEDTPEGLVSCYPGSLRTSTAVLVDVAVMSDLLHGSPGPVSWTGRLVLLLGVDGRAESRLTRTCRPSRSIAWLMVTCRW